MLDLLKTEVTTTIENVNCDKCNQGLYVYSGITYFTIPALYEHKCSHCEATAKLMRSYPRISY